MKYVMLDIVYVDFNGESGVGYHAPITQRTTRSETTKTLPVMHLRVRLGHIDSRASIATASTCDYATVRETPPGEGQVSASPSRHKPTQMEKLNLKKKESMETEKQGS